MAALVLGLGAALSSAAAPAGAQPAGPSLDVRIGQMLMVGFRGTLPGPEHPILEDIRQRHIGGVILFDRDVASGSERRNVRSPGQVRRLTARLQEAADRPLLIAVDQEGGRVSRLPPERGFTAAPSPAELAAAGTEATRRAARETAGQLHRLGLNLNLVPVLDLARNPDSPVIAGLGRSFGAEPGPVSRHAATVVRAHRGAGVLTSVKHFPGHGSARGDTHRGLVDITQTWAQAELTPYRRLLARGLVDTVMVGHLMHRGLDPDWPASLSRRIIHGLLREELGFEGVVILDDLQMGAIREHHDLRTVVRRALEADADILLFGNNLIYEPDIAGRVHGIIRDLVRTGRVSEERIDRSYRRIRALKERLGTIHPSREKEG
ncbi:glycoside hydrolase family 3 protein [Thiohalorhabdus denitrificans]|uniref:glycoside hydrolase family 3 protein n=1 Tax=Thiohalorhabdus denitrificans TaxID=381306 RepID=UPI001E6027CC|nr:glycoside hydrolase family 3 N-terminal domain-containing protein [Thiohalorhabdus denitrificans]